MEIDWMKAPEGTTHWQPENKKLRAAWLKAERGAWYFRMPGASTWCRYSGPPAYLGEIVKRPADGGFISPSLNIQQLGRSNRISQWDGKGLPPAGIDVEFTHGGLAKHEWVRCRVVGYFEGHLYGHTEHEWWRPNGGVCHVRLDEGLASAVIFRQIKTAEQIAAEERQKGIEELGNFLMANSTSPTPYLWEMVQKVYDAGYRKP